MSVEIERKFLVASYPSSEAWPVPYTDSSILQTYLVASPGVTSERVRSRTSLQDGSCVYTHTKKVRLDAGIHNEDEVVVDFSTYQRLIGNADPALMSIVKTRRVFQWAGVTFELDIFEVFHKGLILLEVELPAMDFPVELPPFVQVLREGTQDREYTNAALARKGHWP